MRVHAPMNKAENQTVHIYIREFIPIINIINDSLESNSSIEKFTHRYIIKETNV